MNNGNDNDGNDGDSDNGNNDGGDNGDNNGSGTSGSAGSPSDSPPSDDDNDEDSEPAPIRPPEIAPVQVPRPSPTSAPVSYPQPSPAPTRRGCRNRVVRDEVCYDSNDEITISFQNCAPMENDWIALYPRAGLDRDNLSNDYVEWKLACGSRDCEGIDAEGLSLIHI